MSYSKITPHRVKLLRTLIGISQNDMAAHLHINRRAYQKIEYGKKPMTHVQALGLYMTVKKIKKQRRGR